MILYAGGKAKSPFSELCCQYLKRLHDYTVQIIEVEDKQWDRIQKKPGQYWVMMAETGHTLSSQQFCHQLEHLRSSRHKVCFFIGQANGIPAPIFSQKDTCWSMGAMTWPHLWARVMLLEQLYRAQQMIKGHPYSFI
jgi:23S rRNA (pseudouridine1915-N3)-methyltransferase